MSAGLFNIRNNTTSDAKEKFNVLEQLGNGWLLPILLIGASIPAIILLKVLIQKCISERKASRDGFTQIGDNLDTPFDLRPSTQP
ncbi:MAG: hypothetical protein P1U40_07930 [Coxiellaceae bacterium]|nr:hypothetical protein [Coxiellaceae bacterium]